MFWTADSPRLVLYTPAVSYGYCGQIVGGLWIALGLVGLRRCVELVGWCVKFAVFVMD